MNRRQFGRACAAGLAVVPGWGGPARGEETRGGVLYPVRGPGDSGKFSWFEAVIERVPPLKHDRGSRWPLIAWEGFSPAPQAPKYYQQLLERGLAQHIKLHP